MDFSTQKSSVDSTLRCGRNLARSVRLGFLSHSSTLISSRSTLKTSRVQMVPLSTVKGSAQKAQNQSLSSLRPVTLSYVSSLPSRLPCSDIHFLEQEFGIDIVGEDNKTIVHHKVAARVVCVLTEQEAQLAAPPSNSRLSVGWGAWAPICAYQGRVVSLLIIFSVAFRASSKKVVKPVLSYILLPVR